MPRFSGLQPSPTLLFLPLQPSEAAQREAPQEGEERFPPQDRDAESWPGASPARTIPHNEQRMTQQLPVGMQGYLHPTGLFPSEQVLLSVLPTDRMQSMAWVYGNGRDLQVNKCAGLDLLYRRANPL